MQTRRRFISSLVGSPLLLPVSTLLPTLASFYAQAAETQGYKALVCVFLFGGMDGHDTVLPFDLAAHTSFSGIRSSLMNAYSALPGGSSRSREALLPLNIPDNFGGREFALPPEMAPLRDLFHAGNAAILGNVGPLIETTTRTSFENNQANLPERLFSHNDQQSTWMSFSPEGAQFGWAGRFGDAIATAGGNPDRIFSQVSLFGNTVFLSGDAVNPYHIGVDGVPEIGLIDASGNTLPAALAPLLRDHFTAGTDIRSNLFEQDLVDLGRVSLDANDQLASALRSAPALTTDFPQSFLSSQLSTVAKIISVRDSLDVSRQVFFVGLGGFDTHSAQATTLPGLQQDIANSLSAFFSATEEMGISSEVTTFTASDFGRTLTVNGDGTDHGWGNHHFVVGGSVNGGHIYGDIPEPELGHQQDSGNGRLIPTLPIEHFASPLGSWFGLDQQDLESAIPGLTHFLSSPPSFI